MAARGFALTPLGEVVSFANGKSIKPGGEGAFPVYGSNGIIGYNDATRFQNAIIIGRVGAYCGSIAYCQGKFWASDNTIVAQSKDQQHDIRFLNYLLLQINLNRWAGGAAQPLLTQTVLKGVEAPIPLPEIQRKIASTLSAYDDLIENNLRRIKILEEMAQTIYREWFVKFCFSGHEKVQMVDSPMGKIPEGWEVMAVGDTFEILGGGTPSKKVEGYWAYGDIMWYVPSDLTASKAMFMDSSRSQITELGLKKSSARLFPPLSVMMTSRATLGVIAINTTEACTN